MHKQRDLSCNYSLRENPKKKTQKHFGLESPESMTKILFRCGECGKGFRYEKCLSNHQAGIHLSTNQRVYENSIKNLWSSFNLVKKKKRSRIVRYKKTSLPSSFTKFLESRSDFPENDEELEVAECLILLSKSSPKDNLSSKEPQKAGEFESGFFSNQQKLTEERIYSYETSKEPASFLGDDEKLDLPNESEFLSNEQKLLEASFLGHKFELDQRILEKAGNFDLGLGSMVTESSKKNVEHQCRLCNKIFMSYQALGGHQTFHRMSKSKNKKSCRDESMEFEDESVTKANKIHKCSICSRSFRSVHALGGHKKCHGKKQQMKTEDDDLGLLRVFPVTNEIEFF